jgi:DNA-directed RNA polymerase subunit RPC12/RpoP
MGVRFACHACGKQLNIKQELAGKRGRCPACGLRFRIPQQDQEFSLPLETSEGESDEPLRAFGEPDNLLLGNVNPVQKPIAQGTDSSTPSTGNPSTNRSSAGPVDSTAFDPFLDQAARWYVRPPGGGRYGPADGDTIRLWIREGRVTANTLLWRDGWAEWRELGEFLPDAFGSSAPLPAISHATTGDRETGPSGITVTPTAYLGSSKSQSTLPATGGGSGDYLAAKKQKKARQRATMIALLAATSVFLVIAIVLALVFNTGETATP